MSRNKDALVPVEDISETIVCTWDEKEEIRFVVEEECDSNLHRSSSRGMKLYSSQRGRHAPGTLAYPFALVAW